MKKIFSAIVALALSASAALAQAQLGAGQVWGNSGASRASPKAENVTAILDRAFGSTRGAIIARGASGWALIGPGTAGRPFVTAGAGADSAYSVLGIVGSGTNCSAASGTCLDNITGFASTGFINRTGAGSYSFTAAASFTGVNHATLVGTGSVGFGSVGPGTSGCALISGGALADPAYTCFLQAGTGAVSQTWQAKAQRRFDVEDFGAVGDNSTNDAPAIRAAALAASNAGGGTVYFSCNKTYLLGSKDPAGNAWSLLRIYSNVAYEGCGENSVLRVANGMNTVGQQFHVFYPPDASATYTYTNISFRKFKIDENGLNNLSGGPWQNVAIGCNFCTNVVIDSVWFINNPWSQYVQIGNALNAFDIRITNNYFGNACDLIAGSACTDHSAIYVVAQNYLIANNRFTMSSQSTTASAWELHGIGGVSIGNVVINYNKMVNVAAQLTHTARGMIVANNTGINLRYGITCWAQNSQIIKDLTISNNVFSRSVEPAGSGVGFIDCASQLTNFNSVNVKIIDNTITGTQALGTAATDPAIVVGAIQGTVDVSRNSVYNNNGPCIGNNNALPSSLTNWYFRDNSCIDTGGTSTAASRRCIFISNGGGGIFPSTIDISRNRCINLNGTYITTAIDIAASPNAGLGLIEGNLDNAATHLTLSGTNWSTGPRLNQAGNTFAEIGLQRVILRGVNFNSANTDNQVTIALPAGYTRWAGYGVYIGNASGTLTTATAGVFSTTGGGGTAMCATGAVTVSTASANTANNQQVMTCANYGSNTIGWNFSTLQFRITTAQGSAATADVTFVYQPID